jgi:hypothetical protein
MQPWSRKKGMMVSKLIQISVFYSATGRNNIVICHMYWSLFIISFWLKKHFRSFLYRPVDSVCESSCQAHEVEVLFLSPDKSSNSYMGIKTKY